MSNLSHAHELLNSCMLTLHKEATTNSSPNHPLLPVLQNRLVECEHLLETIITATSRENRS